MWDGQQSHQCSLLQELQNIGLVGNTPEIQGKSDNQHFHRQTDQCKVFQSVGTGRPADARLSQVATTLSIVETETEKI